MDLSVPQVAATELAAAYFQAVITVALALVALRLHRAYRKAYFRDWAVAWGIYALRLGAIIIFLHTGISVWLYWHQVLTGWTALALLWAALAFARRTPWQPWYVVLIAFPAVWSYVAIYQMDNFLLAAGPAVLFLSAATAATAWAFHRYHRAASSGAARLLAFFLILWALHHLDYPFLRARGIWNPWGYYLDVLFELAVGGGFLYLVQEDLDEGLRALSALSSELQSGRSPDGLPAALIERVMALRAVRGSALFWFPTRERAAAGPAPGSSNGTPVPRSTGDETGPAGGAVEGAAGAPPPHAPIDERQVLAAAGACAAWRERGPGAEVAELLRRVARTGEPCVERAPAAAGSAHAYVAALPVLEARRVAGALVVVGDARDPFAALDDAFLVTLGRQIGAAIRNAALTDSLEHRTHELERLQERMVQRHEEERERISRELHDETAQVLAGVNMRLGLIQEGASTSDAERLDEARRLLGDGIRSIRRVVRDLRPAALDDLGLASALRALVRDLTRRGGLRVDADLPEHLPPLPPDAELAVYRAIQEGLANAARHAGAGSVTLRLRRDAGVLTLEIEDDGRGYPEAVANGEPGRTSGLAGIRERIAALGGSVTLGRSASGGASLVVRLGLGADA